MTKWCEWVLYEGMSEVEECVILLDNGSLRGSSTLRLRELAAAVGEGLGGKKVWAVSMLHSGKVDAAELGGEKAWTIEKFLKWQWGLGLRRFRVIPLFFGPSGALMEYLPKRLERLRAEGLSGLSVEMCSPLVVGGEAGAVAGILAAAVRKSWAERGWASSAVALCDHGTPVREVHEVRELVVAELRELLGDADEVKGCSMERRVGEEYDFNEPLLENLLGSDGFDGKVVVAMLFVGPGRHAGPGGDVEALCLQAQRECDSMEVEVSALVGDDVRALSGLLCARYLAKWQSL